MAGDAGRRRNQGGRSSVPEKKPLWRRVVRGLFIWGIALGLLLVTGIGTAVFVTSRSLPSFTQMKSSLAGQMIVVRSRDGT